MPAEKRNLRLSDVLACFGAVRVLRPAAHMVSMSESTGQPAAAIVKVLTRNQVAEILGVAPKTLANWHSSGIGPPALRLHGLVRYDEADFLRWYETQKAAV